MSPLWRITTETIHLPLWLVCACKGHTRGRLHRRRRKKTLPSAAYTCGRTLMIKESWAEDKRATHLQAASEGRVKMWYYEMACCRVRALRGSTQRCAIGGNLRDAAGGSRKWGTRQSLTLQQRTQRHARRHAAVKPKACIVTPNGSMARPSPTTANDTGQSLRCVQQTWMLLDGKIAAGKSVSGDTERERNTKVRWTLFL